MNEDKNNIGLFNFSQRGQGPFRLIECYAAKYVYAVQMY